METLCQDGALPNAFYLKNFSPTTSATSLSVKAQVEDASQWLQAQRGQVADDTPQCPIHGVPMKLNHGKDGRTWYSHKTAQGWCKGR